MCGATTCPLYATLPPNDVEFVVGDAGARMIVTERALLPATRDVSLPVLVIEDGALDAGEPVDLQAAVAAIDPNAITTLIYTSGTTARPKGVELTHASVAAAVARLGRLARLRHGAADHLVAADRARDGPRAALLDGAGQGLRDDDLPGPARDRDAT